MSTLQGALTGMVYTSAFQRHIAPHSGDFVTKMAGKARVMLIGYYSSISLAKAREITKELSARVALGHDVAGEKQERKAEALKKMEEEKHALRVSELAAEYFERQILNRWKHPDILRRRIDKDINSNIGHFRIEEVKAWHIDDMLQKIVQRGAPTVANDVLCWTRRIFDFGIKRHMLESNPTSSFEISGGQEQSRERWLSREELMKFFQAMPMTKGSHVKTS